MQLSLKTKFTLTTSLVVLVVVAVVSSVYVSTLTRQVIRELDDRSHFVAEEVFRAARQALVDAANRGDHPDSASATDIREYVRKTLFESSDLQSEVQSVIGYSPSIYEITIADSGGVAMVSSDASLPGRLLPRRTGLDTLARASFLTQMSVLFGPRQVYEISLPFKIGEEPFGQIRIGLDTSLLRNEIKPGLVRAGWFAFGAVLLSTLLAAVASGITLAPLARISAQLDRISAGESDLPPIRRGDELGQVSTKISRIGQQLRDVREVFSTLRENLNHVMAGFEDGLLLFNAAGRAVLVSPSAEKFLGAKAEALLGRSAGEIFPPGHSLCRALRIENDLIAPVEGAEVELSDAPVHRATVTAQQVSEQADQMGILVTLRDLGQLDRLGSELEVSERLAAIGRVTAGVAHEVKNPLNSMRMWLEVLKTNIPPGAEPQQAVKILDSEIDRLNRVVKTFLDFTRPVEMEFEETSLLPILEEAAASARPDLARSRVELLTDYSPGLPPVRADRHLILQTVLNLIHNACEVMPQGGRLTLSLHQKGDMAEIQVADTGPGIAPENRARIFQLFFTTRKGGTGLGLANAFRFVQLHSGSIEFDSEVGRGTTFRIELPFAHALELAREK
ncbi:MAG: sensor histidine kinase [Candidatus Acidiferrales bacterium]